jgi:site-specific DNA recombinase
MKAVIFCRVSSKEQEETGYSLPAQEKFLRNYGDRQSLEITKVFAISESAAGIVRRKTFNEMMDYVRKKNIYVIVVETTDRLTRNFSDMPTIDQWLKENEEHQVHLAKEACVLHNFSKSHEIFVWRMKVAVAEFYIKQLSENVKKGQKEKLSQGWMPTKPPMGYKTVGETGHKIHIVDEGVAPLIRKMFDLYATGGFSIKWLSMTMFKEGLRSPKGNKVVNSRLHSLLRDPFYIGKIRWNGKIHEGKHQPLISKELFDKVQAMLVSKTTPKYRKHSYLFQGLIRCAGCNGLITWEQQKTHHYGHCNHYHDCTQETWVKEPEVEEQLLSGFDNLKLKNQRIVEWLKKALKESHQDEIEYHNSTVGELQTRYEAIQRRMDKLYDDKLDEKINQEFYSRKFKQYSEEKDELTETIKRHSTASTGYLNLGINLYELSQRAREIYLKAKAKDMLDEQKNLIRLVFAKLILDEGKLSWEYSKAFKILSEAVDETNCSKVQKIDGFENKTFEHGKKPSNSIKKDALLPLRPIWLGGWDDFRTYFLSMNVLQPKEI